jgi:hypothetical protein
VRMHEHVHTHTYRHARALTPMHAHTLYTRTRKSAQRHPYTRTHTRTKKHTHAHNHTRTHTLRHTHTDAHKDTRKHARPHARGWHTAGTRLARGWRAAGTRLARGWHAAGRRKTSDECGWAWLSGTWCASAASATLPVRMSITRTFLSCPSREMLRCVATRCCTTLQRGALMLQRAAACRSRTIRALPVRSRRSEPPGLRSSLAPLGCPNAYAHACTQERTQHSNRSRARERAHRDAHTDALANARALPTQ